MDYEHIEAREAVMQSTMALADLAATHVTIYLTLLTAYVVAAYVVGAKLTRLQLFLTTFLFVTASAFEVFNIGAIGQGLQFKVTQLVEFEGKMQEAFQSSSIELTAGIWSWGILTVGIWSLGIFAALAFMWTVRHPKTE